MRKGDCPFSGSKDVRIDKEHALPQWLRDLIVKRKESPDEMFTMRMGDEIHFKTRNANIEVHAPCRDRCNGGWMPDVKARLRRTVGS
jgi:hypothetical protein